MGKREVGQNVSSFYRHSHPLRSLPPATPSITTIPLLAPRRREKVIERERGGGEGEGEGE